MNREICKKIVIFLLIVITVISLGITKSWADDKKLTRQDVSNFENWKDTYKTMSFESIESIVNACNDRNSKVIAEEIPDEVIEYWLDNQVKNAINNEVSTSVKVQTALNNKSKIDDDKFNKLVGKIENAIKVAEIVDEEKRQGEAEQAPSSEREDILFESKNKEDLSSGIVGVEDKDRNIDTVIAAAKDFISSANTKGTVEESEFQKGIGNIYNIFLAAGMIVVVAGGTALGIKFMLSSVEGKAEVKELLVPYLVGTFIIFGAFGIWKLVMEVAKLL